MDHGCKAGICMTCQICTYTQLGKAIKEWDRKKRGGGIITILELLQIRMRERGEKNKIKIKPHNTQNKNKIKNCITGAFHSFLHVPGFATPHDSHFPDSSGKPRNGFEI